jgi:hypothetical protein
MAVTQWRANDVLPLLVNGIYVMLGNGFAEKVAIRLAGRPASPSHKEVARSFDKRPNGKPRQMATRPRESQYSATSCEPKSTLRHG